MQLHEDFSRKQDAQGSSDRGFGLVFTTFFLVVALNPLRSGHPVRLWALIAAAAFLGFALLWPAALHRPNRLWMQFAQLLSRVFNPIVTGLLFYLVITPAGWLIRRLGNDPLKLRFDPSASTYWIERQPPGPAPDSMSHQF
jgi:hypothetical protein